MRTLVGFAVGCKLPCSMAIAIELCPIKERGKIGMAVAGLAFAAGEMFVCVIGMVVHHYYHGPEWWVYVCMCVYIHV